MTFVGVEKFSKIYITLKGLK